MLLELEAVEAYIFDDAWLRYLSPRFSNAEEFIAQNTTLDWSAQCGFAMDHEGSVIGSVHLGCERPNMVAELAGLIAPRHWGKGVAVEACAAVIDHGFREMGISKVYARADARNTGSIRSMERLGMQLEGRLRAHRLTRDGTRADEVLYGLLR